MLRILKITYILLIIGLLAYSCKQTKYVPLNKYLVKKNIILVEEAHLEEDKVLEIIRQKPNFKTFGIKMRLWAYNRVDSAAVAEKRFARTISLRQENKQRFERVQRINQRRIDKAYEKGSDLYTEKIIRYKDSVNPKLFFREWFKYKIGEKPIVFDSIPFNKSLEQLNVYLRNKGYYYGSVAGFVDFKERKRKAIVTYTLRPGKQYFIDSVFVESTNQSVMSEYAKFVKMHPDLPLLNQPFDSDYLNEYRNKVAKHMRDNTLYGFSISHINFNADTTAETMSVTLGVVFTDRMVRSALNRDSLVPIKHKTTFVKEVYFHIADTTYFKGNFKNTVEQMGLSLLDQQFVRTLDTFVFAEIKKRNSDQLDKFRMATFLYNGELAIAPEVIEIQNYLEHENVYKEYYLERSYSRLLQLGLFQVIKPVLIEVPGTDSIEVHYYLVPIEKQSVGFEPRATNSNGFLGVAITVNYINNNLFRGAEKLTISLSGGFESQPSVFAANLEGDKIKQSGRSFNTFEFGPSVKLELPGLFPTKVTFLSKRQRPRTVLSTAYNYQLRLDFERHIFQLNYLWKFYVSKTQIFQTGLPFMSIIKIVRIQNKPDFQSKLDLLNDLFLKNAYSNQFIWQDWKLTFEYNNKEKEDKQGNFSFYMNSTFDPAGNTLSMFKNFQDTIDNGQHTIFGIGYSQFARLDNEIIVSNPAGRKKSLHARLQFGGGVPFGNTRTSMPYDYSFFAGGANDNRGWKARALGPGSYKYYLDTNRTATQIGDIRIGTSVEYRFSFGELMKGAFFVDAGNVWTFNEDINRPGSKFSSNWYKEIAVSGGFGLRMDLDFFILRLDFGIPLTNPALPQGARWIFQSRDPYYAEGLEKFGISYKSFMPKPFTPNVHFGIGYPF
jgi:outer membrane protein assembly factor BamA